jgi:hypothetical protein
MILGLDISTSITGVTVINNEGEILLCEAIDTRNKNHFPTLFEKASKVETISSTSNTSMTSSTSTLRKALQTFRSGFSSAKTLSTLASFNGIVSWICWGIWGMEPNTFQQLPQESLVASKFPEESKAKQVVMQFLLDNEPEFVILYTKHGNPKPHEFDRADSLVIARAGAINENREAKDSS